MSVRTNWRRDRFGIVLPLVAAALFFDFLAVPLSLRAIAREFGGYSAVLPGIGAGLITATLAAAVYGALGPRRKRVLQTALALFLLGAGCCALANDAVEFGLARALEGAGLGLGLALLSTGALRSRYPCRIAAGTIAAAALCTAFLPWRWLFVVETVLGLASFALVTFGVPRTPKRRAAALDAPGLVLMAALLACALLSLTILGEQPTFSWPLALGLASALLILGVSFAFVETNMPAPILARGFLREWRASGLFILAFILGGEVFASALALPRVAERQSLAEALIVLAAATFVLGLGAAARRRTAAWIGFAAAAVAQVLLAAAPTSLAAALVAAPLIGGGSGAASRSLGEAALQRVTPRWKTGTGLILLGMTGGVVAIAALTGPLAGGADAETRRPVFLVLALVAGAGVLLAFPLSARRG